MPRYLVEVEREVIEVVQIWVDAGDELEAVEEAVEIARSDEGSLISRDVSPDALFTEITKTEE